MEKQRETSLCTLTRCPDEFRVAQLLKTSCAGIEKIEILSKNKKISKNLTTNHENPPTFPRITFY